MSHTSSQLDTAGENLLILPIYANAHLWGLIPAGSFNTAWQLLFVPDKHSHPCSQWPLQPVYNDSLIFKSFHVLEAQMHKF